VAFWVSCFAVFFFWVRPSSTASTSPRDAFNFSLIPFYEGSHCASATHRRLMLLTGYCPRLTLFRYKTEWEPRVKCSLLFLDLPSASNTFVARD
jgi:hypothetical protein